VLQGCILLRRGSLQLFASLPLELPVFPYSLAQIPGKARFAGLNIERGQ